MAAWPRRLSPLWGGARPHRATSGPGQGPLAPETKAEPEEDVHGGGGACSRPEVHGPRKGALVPSVQPVQPAGSVLAASYTCTWPRCRRMAPAGLNIPLPRPPPLYTVKNHGMNGRNLSRPQGLSSERSSESSTQMCRLEAHAFFPLEIQEPES